MTPPASLSDEEMRVILDLAAPIDSVRRNAFLARVTEALSGSRERGPGHAHRICRDLQKQFYDAPRLNVERATSRPAGYALPRSTRPRV
jgi:hypothetical protein